MKQRLVGVKIHPKSEVQWYEFPDQKQMAIFVDAIKKESPRVQFIWNDKPPVVDVEE